MKDEALRIDKSKSRIMKRHGRQLTLGSHNLPQIDDVLVLQHRQEFDLPDSSDGEPLSLGVHANLQSLHQSSIVTPYGVVRLHGG